MIKGDTIFYHYEVHNQGTTGTGLTSGKRYTGTGHATDDFKAVLINGRYSTIGDEVVTNHVVFATAGGKNNITSAAKYHINIDANGNVTFDKISFAWDYCH